MSATQMKLIFVSVLLILSTICASDSNDVQEVQLNQKFDLPFGHKAVVKSEELDLVFSSVVEDSRDRKSTL